MGNESEPNPRQISAVSILVTISGEDIHGQRFIESSTAFLVRRDGAVLDTIHQVAEDTSLEITNMSTNRKAVATVKSLGPRLGPRQRILVEVEDMENFWVMQFGSDRRKPDAPEGIPPLPGVTTAPLESPAQGAAEPLASPAPAAVEGSTESFSGSPEIPIASGVFPPDTELRDEEQPSEPASAGSGTETETSQLNLPATDRLRDVLEELVRSALERNLPSAVDRMTNETRQQAEQITRSVLLDLQEMIETSIVTSISRLQAKAAEVVSAQPSVLNRIVEETIEKAERAIGSRQEEGVSALLDRAQQVEEELASRLGRQVSESADRFSVELEARQNDALASYTAELGKRLEAVENDLVNRPREWEEILTKQLAGRTQEIANSSLADLQRQLAETAATVRETFVQQIGSELNQIQDQFVQQTRQMATEAARQNVDQMHRELVRLVKEMGNALERKDSGAS